MSLVYLSPANKSHSVQSVVFTLDWQGELSDATLTELQSLAPALKSNFPIHSLQNSQTINFGVTADAQTSNDIRLAGIVFSRNRADGNIAGQLAMMRTNCAIVLNDYSRWKPTIEAVMRYFKIILPVILKEKTVGAIGLQYVDKFFWRDDPKNLNLREVFRSDAPYIAPNVLGQVGPWHCHHGYVLEDLKGISGMCLDNINLSGLDNLGEREIQIHTTHQVTLKNPMRLASKDYLQTIESVQNILHLHNKDVLTALLSDEICKKINLIEN